MNIHEAIKFLKSGTPIWSPSTNKRGEDSYFYFKVSCPEANINLYSSGAVGEDLDYHYGFRKTESFSMEEIEATDWEIYVKKD